MGLLARMFVGKREDVAGELRQLLSEGLRNLCCHADRLSFGLVNARRETAIR